MDPKSLLDWFATTGPGAVNALARNTANSLMSGEEPAHRWSMLPLTDDAQGNTSLGIPQMGIDLYNDWNSVDAWAKGAMNEDGNALLPNKLAGINLSGMLPLGGAATGAVAAADTGSLGMFAGRAAKTADHAALSRAEELAKSGTPREQIWKDTGWFQGPDKKWRYEIDDSGATRGELTKTYDRDPTFVGGLIDHQNFFDAYPMASEDLARRMTKAENDRSFGAINTTLRPDGRLYMKHNPMMGDEDYVSTILHELQHGVQRREGFALGTNPRAAGSVENYLKSAGEVESRAVQKRKDLTSSERQGRPPWLDYDVPEADQLFSNPDEALAAPLALNALQSQPENASLLGRLMGMARGAVAGEAERAAIPRTLEPSDYSFMTKSQSDLTSTYADDFLGPTEYHYDGTGIPTTVSGYRGSWAKERPRTPGTRDDEFWGTSSKTVANGYSGYVDGGTKDHHFIAPSDDSSVIPFTAEFQNPYIVNASKPYPFTRVPNNKGYQGISHFAVQDAKSLGHDGVIFNNILEDMTNGSVPSQTIVGLKPGTIKSKLTGETLFSNPDEALAAPLVTNALQQQSPEGTDSLLDRLLKGYANQ